MLSDLRELFARSGGPEHQSLRSLLAGGTLGTAVLQIALAGLGFVAAVVLASMIGVTGYGAYAWAIAWVTVLRVPAVLGRERLLVRNVAAYYARGEWDLLRGVVRHSTRAVAFASMGCVGLASVVVWVVNARIDSPLLSALQVGVILVPIVALMGARVGALQGLHRIVAAQVPDAVIRPLLFLTLLAVAYLTVGDDLTSEGALLLQAVAAGAALLAAGYLLRRTLRSRSPAAAPRYDRAAWNRSALAMASISGLAVVLERFDVILVGAVLGAADAGVYAADVRAATVIGLAMVAVNVALGPIISRLHAMGDAERLRRGITLSTRIAFLITVVVAAVVALAATPLLALFGERFTSGADALRLLSVAALVNAAAAANTLVLIMTRHERAAAVITGIAVVVNIALNAILIPAWGINGAAVTMIATMVVRNGLTSALTWSRLGIDSTILGLRPRQALVDDVS